MKFFSVIALTAAATASALPGSSPWSSSSTVPGYPWGNGFCLTDQQAKFIADKFKSILTAPDRQDANKTATALIADGYQESSDSINLLAGYPLGGVTFNGKDTFIQNVVAAPALASMDTLDVFHDCTKISWRWNVPHLGLDKYPVKGINDLVTNPRTGQVTSNNIEFNSIAWGSDIGWTCTPPSGPPQ